MMPRHIRVVLIAVMLVGCEARPPGPPEATIYGPPAATNAAQREIAAAENLPFQRDRRERLHAVAQMEGLDEATQVRLVNAAFDALPDDEDVEKVLLALIANPSFAPPAKSLIQQRMNALEFPSTRFRLNGALSDRGPLEQ